MGFLMRLTSSGLPGTSVKENLTRIAITEKHLRDHNAAYITTSLTNLKSVIVVSEAVEASDIDDDVMPGSYVKNRYQEEGYQQLLKLDEFVHEGLKTAAKELEEHLRRSFMNKKRKISRKKESNIIVEVKLLVKD